MIATFFCENTLCMANENKMCTKKVNPLKCSFRNDYLNMKEELCKDCPELSKCDECEFKEDQG
jgi:hypothetical protein